MELVIIEGEEKPKMIYTPYVYAVINEYSLCYTVKDGKDIKVIKKKKKDI